ncbi:MAG: hypothetical protein GWN01_15735 [Nitrosopumilaceae archaeon]|nr:hypothetical protein [Nitrosopumilaceae archaeon]NIU88745.1 hypothetical protein [Nitrosopumilaceae archaeon]NIV66880.1 hypothetical protein [Nitrosopumilaceae archaeon]NIX62894.1 hypothetical protein [Nitrosopumilaceae archaeon]
MKQYAVIQHKAKQVTLFSRKLDAVYFHAGDNGKGGERGFRRNDNVSFKEITNKRQLPKGYKVIEK